MSVKGLQDSEKLAAKLMQNVNASLRKQASEIKSEIQKVEYLLGDKDAMRAWRNSTVSPERMSALLAQLDETERLYLEAGDTNAARIFKSRMKRQLEQRLTNLKANELEVQMRIAKTRLQGQQSITQKLTEIRREGCLTEMYNQSRSVGGFLSNFGKAYLQDLVTLETKAAGSKTLGQYMANLYNTYETKLKDVFVRGIVRGDSYKKMVDNLQAATDITVGKANLLIRTEANAIFNESVHQVIDDNPLVKGYRFRAVLDRRTSHICQEHDGEYIPKEDAKPGVNYPPLHPNCRSTVTVVLVSEDEKKDTVQRYTKNGSNQWITVPPGTTYAQYKQMFLQPPRTAAVETSTAQQVLRLASIDPSDPRITRVGGINVIPNVPGSAAMLDSELSDAISPAAKARYAEIKRTEPRLTDIMLDIAGKSKGSLSGVEFSVKTASSVEEKINRVRARADRTDAGVSLTDEQIIAEMSDVLRYTVVVEPNDIVKATQDTIDTLTDKGIDVVSVDNKYLSGDGTYKGIHIGAVIDGHNFEVQVHSPQSLDVKNKNHKLYEVARKPDTSKAKVEELEYEMRQLASSVPIPKDIEDIQSSGRGTPLKIVKASRDDRVKAAHEYFTEKSGLYDIYDPVEGSRSDLWLKATTESERDAVNEYTGNAYRDINRYLSKRPLADNYMTTDELEDKVYKISSAISKSELDTEMEVYRYADDYLLQGVEPGKEVGTVIDVPSFTSTTLARQDKFRDVEYVISVPKGQGVGAYIAPVSGFPTEAELLLQKDSKCVINYVTEHEGKKRVYLAVLEKK